MSAVPISSRMAAGAGGTQPEPAYTLAPMQETDLDAVLAIEAAVYSHPWTRANFADSLRTGYQCWTARRDGGLTGYFVLSVALGEAHLLNLSVALPCQRRGYGRALLGEIVALARSLQAQRLFLEVRPSNRAAIMLYQGSEFRQLAVRRGYYPAHGGREDALVFTRHL